nr:MAG TPA: hypothetical protein [Bacteriophage sp.]
MGIHFFLLKYFDILRALDIARYNLDYITYYIIVFLYSFLYI